MAKTRTLTIRERVYVEKANKWAKSKPVGYFIWRRIARRLSETRLSFVSRFIWKRQVMACDYCGRLVGLDSTVSKFGFTCEPCLEELKKKSETVWPRK